MPDLEHDHLALFGRKPGQCLHRGAFGFGFPGGRFEPALGFEFAEDAAEEAAAVVEGAVAEGADEVVVGLAGRMVEGEQRAEGVVEHVLCLGVAESEGPAIEDHFGGALIVEARRPMGMGSCGPWIGPGSCS